MKNFYENLRFLFQVYLCGLAVFFLFRLTIFLSFPEQVYGVENFFRLLAQSFAMGLRFDLVVSSYILILPLTIAGLGSMAGRYSTAIEKGIAIYFAVTYTIAIFIGMMDILYFRYFFRHLNASILNWADEKGFVFEMLAKDFVSFIVCFFAIVVPFLFCYLIFYFVQRSITKRPREFSQRRLHLSYFLKTGFLTACILGLCVLGIRGRLAIKSPIRVGTAYFSNHAFFNELGLNPVFYFLRTAIDRESQKKHLLSLIPDKEALAEVVKQLQVTDLPLGREKRYHERNDYNVVLVLMEGIPYAALKDEKTRQYIPFLDSLSHRSLFFSNCYSAGIHTMNGLSGSLFGYPAILQSHPFKSAEIKKMDGFPNVLKRNGYQTAYFTTHDDQFDNVGGFLKANDVQFILSQRDYPKKRVLSNLGVPDDYMFERAIPELNRMAGNGRPFFSALLTASNHTPIIIPDYFKPRSGDLKLRALEYADWSLQKFFQLAQQEPWYSRTIFVFCSDHGSIFGRQPYSMPVTFNHIPMMIVSPGLEPAIYDSPAGQIDIFPTVMGLLGINYRNNTFGIDLLEKKREYIFFSADQSIACIGDSLLYTYHTDGREGVYNYRNQSSENKIHIYPEEAEKMKRYAFSMIQSAQHILRQQGGK